MISFCLAAKSQINENSFQVGFGLQTDFLNIAFSDHTKTENTKVYVLGRFDDRINVKVGYSLNTVKQMEQNQFKCIPSISAGIGYCFNNKKHEHFSTELFVSFSNSIAQFSGFENTNSTVEINWHLFNTFFFGMGVKHSHFKHPFLSDEDNVFGIFWQLGGQFLYPFKNNK